MSKRARHPDQAAIDMVTVGTFLSVTAATYQGLGLIEEAVEEAKKINDAFERSEKIEELVGDIADMTKRYGPAGPIIFGRSDADEKAKVYRVLRKYLGYDRPGGIL